VPPGRGVPTYRVADLSNPILQDWVKPGMKKANDEVLAGGVAYRAHERCWLAGVPTFDTDVVGAPLFIYQGPNEIVVIMHSCKSSVRRTTPKISLVLKSLFHNRPSRISEQD
jgi:hypothetical protein